MAVVWIVSILSLISNSSSFLSKIWDTIPTTSSTIGITVTLLFNSFFSSLARYLSIFSLSFISTQYSTGTAKSSRQQAFFFLLITTRSGLLAGIGWPTYISKPLCISCISFSRTDHGLCIYHLSIWGNFSFLQDSHWITFPNKSCLFLYFLSTSFLYVINCFIYSRKKWTRSSLSSNPRRSCSHFLLC